MTRIDAAPFTERAYRALDRLVFGRTPMVVQHDNGALSVTFDGWPADQLERAVREQLGQPGGTVEASVWNETSGKPVLLFRGQCALDHRSLGRSIAWVRAKLPALLKAAYVRQSRNYGKDDGDIAGSPHVAPLAATKLIRRVAAEVLGRLQFRDQWLIQLHAPTEDGSGVGELLASIEPPQDRFWADPFLYRREGRLWLFFEELLFGKANAHLSAVEIDESGRLLGNPQCVLAEPWHISYPFLWEEDGRLFMIPESSAHATVDLYECTAFPSQWRKRCTLIEGALHADATVVRHGGRLWMFSTGASIGGSLYDELYLHSAACIEGPWRAHPLNPVKVDARSARPAGCMWIDADGCVVRPVQDCSTIYGGAVRLQRVTALDNECFEEIDLGRVPVPPELMHSRFHTFNSQGGAVVIDVLRSLPRRHVGLTIRA